MAPPLDEQGVEEEEACTRASQTHHTLSMPCFSVHTHYPPPEDGSSPHTPPTFEGEPVVTHAFTQVLPNHVFHIFQRTRFQRAVEARPLRKQHPHERSVTSRCEFKLKKKTHLEKVELVIVENAVVVQV